MMNNDNLLVPLIEEVEDEEEEVEENNSDVKENGQVQNFINGEDENTNDTQNEGATVTDQED